MKLYAVVQGINLKSWNKENLLSALGASEAPTFYSNFETASHAAQTKGKDKRPAAVYKLELVGEEGRDPEADENHEYAFKDIQPLMDNIYVLKATGKSLKDRDKSYTCDLERTKFSDLKKKAKDKEKEVSKDKKKIAEKDKSSESAESEAYSKDDEVKKDKAKDDKKDDRKLKGKKTEDKKAKKKKDKKASKESESDSSEDSSKSSDKSSKSSDSSSSDDKKDRKDKKTKGKKKHGKKDKGSDGWDYTMIASAGVAAVSIGGLFVFGGGLPIAAALAGKLGIALNVSLVPVKLAVGAIVGALSVAVGAGAYYGGRRFFDLRTDKQRYKDELNAEKDAIHSLEKELPTKKKPEDKNFVKQLNKLLNQAKKHKFTEDGKEPTKDDHIKQPKQGKDRLDALHFVHKKLPDIVDIKKHAKRHVKEEEMLKRMEKKFSLKR